MPEALTLGILFFQGLILFGIIIAVIVLAVIKNEQKHKEDFEKRDN